MYDGGCERGLCVPAWWSPIKKYHFATAAGQLPIASKVARVTQKSTVIGQIVEHTRKPPMNKIQNKWENRGAHKLSNVVKAKSTR